MEHRILSDDFLCAHYPRRRPRKNKVDKATVSFKDMLTAYFVLEESTAQSEVSILPYRAKFRCIAALVSSVPAI